MMFFKGIRRVKNSELLAWHTQKMSALEQFREAYEDEGRLGMVLATNFELVSHASRALTALRKLEELGDTITEQAAARLRLYLGRVLELPAIPRAEVSGTDANKIKRLYDEYRSLARTAAPGESPGSSQGIQDSLVDEPPSPKHPTPELCTKESIMAEFGITAETFERKYASYEIALTLGGERSHWNAEIDDYARSINALSEQEIRAAHKDMHQAVLNRVKVSLATGGRI